MNVCRLPECQTTAGCMHRGPHFEYCWFPPASDQQVMSNVFQFDSVTMKEHRNSIIEECARVAELYSEDGVYPALTRTIAAAIRALKDKP